MLLRTVCVVACLVVRASAWAPGPGARPLAALARRSTSEDEAEEESPKKPQMPTPAEALEITKALVDVVGDAWTDVEDGDPRIDKPPADAWDGNWLRRGGPIDWKRYAPLPKSDLYFRGEITKAPAGLGSGLRFQQDKNVVQLYLETDDAAHGGRALTRREVTLDVRPRRLTLDIAFAAADGESAPPPPVRIERDLSRAVVPDGSFWSFEDLQGGASGRYILIELEKKKEFENWEDVFSEPDAEPE